MHTVGRGREPLRSALVSKLSYAEKTRFVQRNAIIRTNVGFLLVGPLVKKNKTNK